MDHFSNMLDLTVSLSFFQWLYLLGPTVGAFFLVIFITALACWPKRTRAPSGDKGEGSFRSTSSFFPPYRFHASRSQSVPRRSVRGSLPARSE
jgi:hypothetical protein